MLQNKHRFCARDGSCDIRDLFRVLGKVSEKYIMIYRSSKAIEMKRMIRL